MILPPDMLSVMVALRMAMPNSISLMFPMTLPRAFWGPPDKNIRDIRLLRVLRSTAHPQYIFIYENALPGQAWVLHLDSWEESPGHGRPLSLGDGLLQRRTRVLSPPPQEAEHSPHGCHEPQLPSTAMMKQKKIQKVHTLTHKSSHTHKGYSAFTATSVFIERAF